MMVNINSKPALANRKALLLTAATVHLPPFINETSSILAATVIPVIIYLTFDTMTNNDSTAMNLPPINLKPAKHSTKPLREQINVVAEYHAHKIPPQRIAYRTGIEPELVNQLINGENHQRLFKMLLSRHHKTRRDQRLKKSLRHKGITQATLQDQIEQEYQQSISGPAH